MQTNNRLSAHLSWKTIPLCLGQGAAVLLLLMMLLTFADVMGRYFFGHPIKGAYELTEVLLAFVVFFALPLTTLESGHITVALFDSWFSDAAKKVKALLIDLAMVAVQGVMTWRLGSQASDMVAYGDVSMFLKIPYGWIACIMAVMAAMSTLFSLYLALKNAAQFNNRGAIQ